MGITARGCQRSVPNEFISRLCTLLARGTLLAGEPPIPTVLGYACGVLSAPLQEAFSALCTQLMSLELGSFPSPIPYASLGMAFSLRPTRGARFSIPLLLPQQPRGVSPLGGQVPPRWQVQSLSPGCSGSPLARLEHSRFRVLWLARLLASPWVWALILA